MAEEIRITRSLSVPTAELEFRFSRAGGPGGQHANTRETRVELVFDIVNSPSLGAQQKAQIMDRLGSRIDDKGRLRVVAADERSQTRNRELAIGRFRDLLAEALRSRKKRRRTKPSKGAEERRLKRKKRRGRKKRERKWKPPPDEV